MYTLYKYKEGLKRIRLIQMGGILLPFIAATGVATGLIMEETRITGEINYMWIRTIVSYLIILIVLVGTIIPMIRIIANLFTIINSFQFFSFLIYYIQYTKYDIY